jgi:hypothetical protein
MLDHLDVAIVGADLKANCNNKFAKNMSDLIDISAKLRTALIQGRENNEPTDHQVHSTMYVEDSNKILVAKSKKKISAGTNLCNNENKTDVMSCIRIVSILLKIKEPRDHVWVPQGFPKGWIPSFQVLYGLSPPDNEISWYGKFKSSSGPTQNPGVVHIKTDAQVIYDIKLGLSWTLWKDKEIIFSMRLVPYPTKI